MSRITEYRTLLDNIDIQILSLLEKRMNIIKDISIIKFNENINCEDISRENEIIKNINNNVNIELKDILNENIINNIWKNIFVASKKLQLKLIGK